VNPSESPATLDTARRAAAQALRGWRSAGLTHLARADVATASVVETPPEAGKSSVVGHVESAVARLVPSTEIGEAVVSPPSPKVENMPARSPVAVAANASRAQQLAALACQVAACTRCRELAETRKQTVFGVGDPHARVMFIGEAPGADEDAQGEPFVGKAGQLLNRIITACGWRREDLYICNILRCRPPGNRNPSDDEARNCREWLDGQIAIVDPEYIVCWGSIAAKNLLGSEETIGKLRSRWFQHGRAKVLCTYHPSYLLRNPSAKKPVWDDMLLLLGDMGLEPPQR
jgi:uracil-DNA glycosylase family 4